MTLPQNDLSGYDSEEVPMVELSDDEMLYLDSKGTATVILNKQNYESQELKNRSKTSGGYNADGSPLPSPPGLFYQNGSPGDSPLMNSPATPKSIPPIFQFMGAVAGKAKEFFGGPPPAPSPVSPKKQMSSTQYTSIPPPQYGAQPKQAFAYNDFPRPPMPPQQFQYYGQKPVGLQPTTGMMGFVDPQMDFNENAHHKKKAKKSKKKHSKKSKNSSDSDSKPELVSTMLLLLIFLSGGLVYMLTGTRLAVEGPISAAVNRFLGNLQMGAMIAIAASGSLIGFRFYSPKDDSEQPVSSPAPSYMCAAGTSFGSSSPLKDPMDVFHNNGGLPGAYWAGQHLPQSGPPGYMPYAPPAPILHPPLYQGMPGGIPAPMHRFPTDFGYHSDDSDDELDFIPAGATRRKHAPFKGRRGPGSPMSNPFKIEGLTQEMLDEEQKQSYYEPMPYAPDIDGEEFDLDHQPSYVLRPDPELLRQSEKKPVRSSERKPRQKEATPKSSSKKQAAPQPKVEERVKPTTKSTPVYVDEYACKPYGPPPKRYRGVNV